MKTRVLKRKPRNIQPKSENWYRSEPKIKLKLVESNEQSEEISSRDEGRRVVESAEREKSRERRKRFRQVWVI